VVAGLVAVLVAVLALRQVGDSLRSVTGNGLAAERIDVTAPAAPIGVVGQFGADPVADGADNALDHSATNDRAVAAVFSDLQTFWSEQLSAAGGPGLKPLAG